MLLDMAARFRIYESRDDVADRFTILDSRPQSQRGERWYNYGGFGPYPFHPQGVGMHGEMKEKDYYGHVAEYFRGLGKRIKGDDLPTDQAKKFVLQFMQESGGTPQQIRTAMKG
jgi:hypothetical protein